MKSLRTNKGRPRAIPRSIKHAFFRALVTILDNLKHLGRLFQGIGRFLYKPIFWCLKKLYRLVVLPTYFVILSVRKKIKKLFGPAKNKFIYPFIAKPVIHIVVALLIISVTAANVQARTVPSTGGQNSILFSLVGGTDFELIEETADNTNRGTATSYLGSAYGVNQRQVAIAPESIPVSPSTALLTTGGNSIAAQPSISGSLPAVPGGTVRKNRDEIETYIVQSGDTISGIASKFGLYSSTILWANDLGTNDFIRPGDELTILPVNGITHTVKSGDTLIRLANTYDASAADITSFNNLEEDTLSVGATIIIPDGVKPRPTPSRTIVRNTPTTTTTQPTTSNIFQPSTQPTSPETGSSNMIWPTSGRYITQYWGWRHTGVDIDDDRPGAPVYAVARGVVETAGWNSGGYGIQVVISHLDANGNPNGIKTRYAHLAALYVVQGQTVEQGHVLGPVGTTGRSTGTHLHFEVYVNGIRRNPLLYVR